MYSLSMKNATSLSPLGRCLILFGTSDQGKWCMLWNLLHRILKFINYANLCISISQSMKYATSLSFLEPSSDSVGALSDRAWWGLQHVYTVLWNSLIMQVSLHICIQKQQKMLLLYFRTHFDSVCFIWQGMVGASKLCTQNCQIH